jgi:hypothetical protein
MIPFTLNILLPEEDRWIYDAPKINAGAKPADTLEKGNLISSGIIFFMAMLAK